MVYKSGGYTLTQCSRTRVHVLQHRKLMTLILMVSSLSKCFFKKSQIRKVRFFLPVPFKFQWTEFRQGREKTGSRLLGLLFYMEPQKWTGSWRNSLATGSGLVHQVWDIWNCELLVARFYRLQHLIIDELFNFMDRLSPRYFLGPLIGDPKNRIMSMSN